MESTDQQTTRTVDDVNRDYGIVCAHYGDTQFQIQNLKDSAQEMVKKLKELREEGTKLHQEAQKLKAVPDVEGAPV